MDLKLFVNISLLVILLFSSIGTIVGYGYAKQRLIFFTKPLITPVLVLYYVLNTHQIYPVIIIALILSFLGDFFQMWQSNMPFFLAGLIFFILMFILYIVFILSHQVQANLVTLSLESIIMGCVYLLLGTLLFLLLYPYIRSLKIPMILYLLAILIVSYICFQNVKMTMSEISFVQYMGSLLFIISGTLMVMDFFRKPIRYGGIYITITYIVAQIFLLAGFMNT